MIDSKGQGFLGIFLLCRLGPSSLRPLLPPDIPTSEGGCALAASGRTDHSTRPPSTDGADRRSPPPRRALAGSRPWRLRGFRGFAGQYGPQIDVDQSAPIDVARTADTTRRQNIGTSSNVYRN